MSEYEHFTYVDEPIYEGEEQLVEEELRPLSEEELKKEIERTQEEEEINKYIYQETQIKKEGIELKQKVSGRTTMNVYEFTEIINARSRDIASGFVAKNGGIILTAKEYANLRYKNTHDIAKAEVLKVIKERSTIFDNLYPIKIVLPNANYEIWHISEFEFYHTR